MCYISLNKYSAKSPYSPDSPTCLATMYGTDLHTFGENLKKALILLIIVPYYVNLNTMAFVA